MILIWPFLLFYFFIAPFSVQAFEFEVQNEYKTGIGYTAVLPQDKGVVAAPFKVGSEGNYKDFQFMLQQGYYIGRSYGFGVTSPYFDPITLYPTTQYFDHVKMAILPSDHSTSDSYPTQPDFVNWRFYGDTSKAAAIGSKPVLLEPEIIKDSSRYKWLQFKIDTGVNLGTEKWYWLVLFTDSNPDSLEEWEFTGMKITADFAKATEATSNFGVAKGWHDQLGWYYLNNGEFIGFRIGSSTPVPTNKTPVVIIPGIGGSEFKVSQEFVSDIRECGDQEKEPYFFPRDEIVWVNLIKAADIACDDYFDVLKLNVDGQTPQYPNIVLNGAIYASSYSSLIQFLHNQGYELNKTLFVFPYDWRKDVSLTSPLLNNLISTIKSQSGKDKVDIIAHSMGGLVARKYISDPSQAINVRKLITLGTPLLGSVEFLKTLVYGKWVGKSPLGIDIGIEPEETRDVFNNMPGGYQLLPSRKYPTFYDNSSTTLPAPYSDQRDIDNNGIVGELDYDQTKTLLTNLGHNTQLYDFADALHIIDNNLNIINGVQTIAIVGSGIPTLGQLQEKFSYNFLGIKSPKTDEIPVNGDKSVPLYSASMTDKSRSIDLGPEIIKYYVHFEHGDLPKATNVQDLIGNILNNNSGTPSSVQNEPYSLEGQQVSMHSPVEIHAYDSAGNHTGPLPNGDFETNIPGSSYDTLVDSKFIWLPQGNFTIKLDAIGKGEFDLKIRKYDNDVNTETQTFQQIPIEATSQGEVQTTENPIIILDKNGDGSPDENIPVTSKLNEEQATDFQAPITQITIEGTKGSNDWYQSDIKVTLSAEDTNAGILKTEYSLDGGQTALVYDQPFNISKEGINNLLVMSTDKAGNTETPIRQTLKIDKSKPQVKISANPNVLWPPSKKLVKVRINGSAIDTGSGVISKVFDVVDEYNQVEPKITDFGQTIKLQSWRGIRDWNGRIYRVKVRVADLAGNINESYADVTVPYFKR